MTSAIADPADRKAEILLQHLEGVACTDILSGERLTIDTGRITLQVPAGIPRVVDVEHR